MRNLYVSVIKYSLPNLHKSLIHQNCSCQIQCNFGDIDDLCKLGKECLIALTCKWSISF